MVGFGVKYAALLGTVMLVFGNFVACGAQLYEVSLTNDVRAESPAYASDPSSYTYAIHAPQGWSKLPIHFKVGQSLTDEQKNGLLLAMATWETAVGRKLFAFEGVHHGIDGDSFKDLYSSLSDLINGHYLDNYWDKTGKPSVVLATTIWDNEPHNSKRIATADIRFNGDNYLLGNSMTLSADGDKEVVDMETLALHELGHLLGLAHVSPAVDNESIMMASLFIGEGLANRVLSKGDLERIQRVYGCAGHACDLEATLGLILHKKMGYQAEPDPDQVHL